MFISNFSSTYWRNGDTFSIFIPTHVVNKNTEFWLTLISFVLFFIYKLFIKKNIKKKF